MAVRDIIEIDQKLCDGCGLCVTACAEGAIALVDGKARLVSETYCDGLGACLGECPQGAITVVRRDSADFDQAAVEQHLAARERAVKPMPVSVPLAAGHAGPAHFAGCPGSQARVFAPPPGVAASGGQESSQLRQWPVQLHLLSPTAPYFANADVLLAADCVAFAVGGFHSRFLKGRSLAIACPKLDSNQQVYLQKLVSMIDEAGISSLTVMVMEVPCCSGLVRMAQQAASRAQRTIPVPVSCLVVGLQGNILAEYKVA